MRITDEQKQYQGWYVLQTGLFSQSSSLVTLNAIKINQDVIETLTLLGCKTIETSVEYGGGHIEPYYISFDRFLEVANTEWNNEKQNFDYVYNAPGEA